ncbi:MAG: isochorismatase family protein [Arcanobacterium sp.]
MTEQRALIIVDVQPTFCEGGALGVEGGNAIAEKIADFVTEYGHEYAYIVTTQDWHIEPGAHFSDNPDFVDTWPAHGVADTAEAELHDEIAALSIDDSVKKGQYSASYTGFDGTNADSEPLEHLLRRAEITAIDVVGIAESHCVKETAMDAVKLGWPTRVFSDLTIPTSPELGAAARVEMDEAGVEQMQSRDAFGFYEDDEDDVPLLAEEWDEYAAQDESDWDEEALQNDEYGAADYEEDELPEGEDPGVIQRAPRYDNYDDGEDEELDGSTVDARHSILDEDLSALDDFDDDFDLDEDIDFSDDADEEDFDFSDLR